MAETYSSVTTSFPMTRLNGTVRAGPHALRGVKVLLFQASGRKKPNRSRGPC